MTLGELEELRVAAGKVSGSPVGLSIGPNGEVSVHRYGLEHRHELHNATMQDAIAFMKRLATPPPPKTVTITFEAPYEWARVRGVWHSQTKYGDATDALIGKACEEAVNPFEK